MEESVLKATNVKLSSLVWKIRLSRDNFSVSVTDCNAIFPTHRIFHWNWSPKKYPKQHCATKQGPTTTNLTAPDLEHYLQSKVIAYMQTAQKTAKRYENTSNFKATPSQTTPNAYHVIVLCLSNHTTPSWTQTPLHLTETLSSKRPG